MLMNTLTKIEIKDHPFFHRMPESEQPVVELLEAKDFEDFPALYEIYEASENVILEDSVIQLTPEQVAEDEHAPADGLITFIAAYHLGKRYIVAQEANTLNVVRYNLPGAKQVHEAGFKRWWYFRELMSTRKGREQMKGSGFRISKPL